MNVSVIFRRIFDLAGGKKVPTKHCVRRSPPRAVLGGWLGWYTLSVDRHVEGELNSTHSTRFNLENDKKSATVTSARLTCVQPSASFF